MEEQKLEELRHFFAGDRFATDNGAWIEEVGEGYAICSMKIEEKHLNAIGSVMGGVAFTLADFAFAVATNWKQAGTVSLHSDIAYVGGVKGDTLIAKAECVKDGRTTCYYRIHVTDNLENPVAEVNITGFHKA